jgi:transient receptor potential cation channel subfamily M member 2
LPRLGRQLIISITGGAGKLESLGKSQDVIERGLAKVVNVASAWIITGGTDSGVMQMAGAAIAANDRTQSVPCLGIMPWRALKGRQGLMKSAGELRSYNPGKGGTADGEGAPLNRDHSHFIFVDDIGRADDSVPPWGKENDLRARVENFFANELHVPLVLLVVDGGAGTLDTVQRFTANSLPVVVISDSGRAATAIAMHCLSGGTATLTPEFTKPAVHEKLEAIRRQQVTGPAPSSSVGVPLPWRGGTS